jgi:hypothetical protein
MKHGSMLYHIRIRRFYADVYADFTLIVLLLSALIQRLACPAPTSRTGLVRGSALIQRFYILPTILHRFSFDMGRVS